MRALSLLFLCALPALATEYAAELEVEPVPDPLSFMGFSLEPVPQAGLPEPPAAEDRVFAGSFRLTPDHPELRVVLVEPPQGEPRLYADADLDGKLGAGERFAWGDVLLKVPPPGPPGLPFPVLLCPFPGPAPQDGSRRMLRSRGARVEGRIEVGLKEVLVRYPVDPRTGQVSLKGRIGMDLDGDGVIEPALTAGEVKGDVGDGPRIFKMRDTYLSTAGFDPATGRVTVRTHPASDYKEFDLRPGAELADFAFTDLDGRQRRFSELRGKVVLLDFWATSCGPCIAEMPALRKVQQDLGARGFVILGTIEALCPCCPCCPCGPFLSFLSPEHLLQGVGADEALSPAEEPLRVGELDPRPVPAGERAELPLRLAEKELRLSLPPPLLLPLTRPLEQGVSTHVVSFVKIYPGRDGKRVRNVICGKSEGARTWARRSGTGIVPAYWGVSTRNARSPN